MELPRHRSAKHAWGIGAKAFWSALAFDSCKGFDAEAPKSAKVVSWSGELSDGLFFEEAGLGWIREGVHAQTAAGCIANTVAIR